MALSSTRLGQVRTTTRGHDSASPSGPVAPDAPDGSTVELLQGARLVFFQDYQLVSLVSLVGMTTTNISTVVAWAPVTLGGAVTADRYVGPQDTMFTIDSANLCPGAESEITRSGLHSALVGQWRIGAPDGTVATIDSAADGG